MNRTSVKNKARYLVLGSKPWNLRLFDERLKTLPGSWHYLGAPGELSLERVREIDPRYLFFLHWSWKVPAEIVEQYECVCFHMTDVPYGRGGSPLQNLIVRGRKETKLTALRMSRELDAGPVYRQAPLSLQGGGEEIYLRAGQLAAEMIAQMVRLQPKAVPQKGKVVTFKRRRPQESELGAFPPAPASLEALFDFIRMLDAEGYPPAFLEHSGFRFEFSRPALYEGRIAADVKITRTPPPETSR
jgi:methionyl-tRNA formyltransferase